MKQDNIRQSEHADAEAAYDSARKYMMRSLLMHLRNKPPTSCSIKFIDKV
jgi:hypothetical protein